MDVKIRVKVGRTLRPDQLTNLERIELAIEDIVGLSLQALFESVSVEEIYTIPSYLNDAFSDTPPTHPFILEDTC
jgi:hypothetical protein